MSDRLSDEQLAEMQKQIAAYEQLMADIDQELERRAAESGSAASDFVAALVENAEAEAQEEILAGALNDDPASSPSEAKAAPGSPDPESPSEVAKRLADWLDKERKQAAERPAKMQRSEAAEKDDQGEK
jgi:hypothetical protein